MELLRPTSLDEAIALKADRPDAVPIAGGTDLMVELNAGSPRPEAMIDLTVIPGLGGWRDDGATVFLGAGVTYSQILAELDRADPLAQAARTVGSAQIRNRGTVGGNLATASPAGDTLPVLAAHDAEIVLASTDGTRSLPWHEFLVGPKHTALGPTELIVGTRWPQHRHLGSFSKVGGRAAMAIAVASLALILDEDTREVRAALGSVGPTVLRAPDAEVFAAAALAEAGTWDDPTSPVPSGSIEHFAALTAAAARPIDDHRGSAAYRRHACQVLAGRALRWLLEDRIALATAATA